MKRLEEFIKAQNGRESGHRNFDAKPHVYEFMSSCLGVGNRRSCQLRNTRFDRNIRQSLVYSDRGFLKLEVRYYHWTVLKSNQRPSD